MAPLGPPRTARCFRVVEQVKATNAFDLVQVGFMELNEPSIPYAIDTLVEQGATSVVAVPYFLHAGTHVADDLPTLLEEAQEKYPQVDFSMGDYLGHDALLMDVLAQRVNEVA